MITLTTMAFICHLFPMCSHGCIKRQHTARGPVSQMLYEILVEICKYMCCPFVKPMESIKSQFCTCHDSSAVVACAKLWVDSITRLTDKIKKNFRKISITSSYTICEMWRSSWRALIHRAIGNRSLCERHFNIEPDLPTIGSQALDLGTKNLSSLQFPVI